MDPSHHNVTVTILDVSLELVHIPRSRLTELTRPILKQLLRKKPKFLNLTANELELSIFAEDGELVDFQSIARSDRHKLRQCAGAGNGTDPSFSNERRRRRTSLPDSTAVELSMEKWRVLQIDSHDDSQSQSGSRVREISAPLAAAGVSIFYQSSYLSDFIFIKECRLPVVMKLLDEAGFTMYNTDLNSEDFQGIPLTPDPYFDGFVAEETRRLGFSMPSSPGPGAMSPAVLSRTRSPSMASIAALSQSLTRQGLHEDFPSSALLIMHRSRLNDHSRSTSPAPQESRTPKKSPSPTAVPVDVLDPDVACVGLSDASADIWTTKLLTLVGYPELIPARSEQESFEPLQRRKNSLAESLYGSFRESHIRANERLASQLQMSEAIVRSRRYKLDEVTVGDWQSSPEPSIGSSPPDTPSSSDSDASSEDEYFSSSPYETAPKPKRSREMSTSSNVSATSVSSPTRSLPDRLATSRKKPPRLNAVSSTASTPSPIEQEAVSSKLSSRKPQDPLRVPFFSFTRTTEGSSLTTDLGVLSALFTPDERHMIISPETLLDEGDELNRRAALKARLKQIERQPDGQIFHLDSEEWLQEDGEDGAECAPGTMKCLQIDLQKFGLEKHGLVSRFSQVLEENGINHMYSSTYKTANLLVDKCHAWKAQSLLRSC